MHCLLMGHTLSGLDFLELQVTLFSIWNLITKLFLLNQAQVYITFLPI